MASTLTLSLIAVTVAFVLVQSRFSQYLGDFPSRRIPDTDTETRFKTIMQVVVSVVILSGALYIVLSHTYAEQDKHWAYGVLGTILGFWLKK